MFSFTAAVTYLCILLCDYYEMHPRSAHTASFPAAEVVSYVKVLFSEKQVLHFS